MGLGNESPVISVWDNDKLVGLFIDSPTTSSRQPDRLDEEIVRIFNEHKIQSEQIKELKAESVLLKKDIIKYGAHNYCSGEKCTCGFDEVKEKALKG